MELRENTGFLNAPRIVVLGCGGIGGIVSARLARAGHDVTAITHNPEIAESIEASGISAFFDDAFHRVSFPAHAALEEGMDVEPFDLCLLAVPPNCCEQAVSDVLPWLREAAPVVSLPNGLIEERLRSQLDEDRIVGGIVSFGGSMIDAGRVRQTSSGGLTLGRLDGSVDPVVRRLAELLAVVGPIDITENLRGARWSKLAINCAISSLGTIGGDRLGALMRYRHVRRLALETMTEVVDVARAEGVELEKVSGTLDLEWMALDDDERLRRASASLLAKHTVLLAVGAKYRKLRSSMLRALERGRTPPVDYLNGEITSRGEEHSIPTPINAALQRTVHALDRGELEPAHGLLRDLYDETRPVLRELEMVA